MSHEPELADESLLVTVFRLSAQSSLRNWIRSTKVIRKVTDVFTGGFRLADSFVCHRKVAE